jgi:hypothetical protein
MWALNRPIGESKWAGNLSFGNYQNVDNVKNEFCRVASTIAYMTHRKVFQRFQFVAQEIREELEVFDEAYNTSFGGSIDFSSAWEQALR